MPLPLVEEAGKKLQEAKQAKAEVETRAANARKDIKHRTEASTDEKFSITVGNKAYTDKKETPGSVRATTDARSAGDTYPEVSIISIRELLSLVKGEDLKYLPQTEPNGAVVNGDEDYVEYSIRRTSKRTYENQIHDLFHKNGKSFMRDDDLYVMGPNKFDSSIGLAGKPFFMLKRNFSKSTRSAGNNVNYSSHAVSEETMLRVPEHIQAPALYVVGNGRVSAIASETVRTKRTEKAPLLIGINPNAVVDGQAANEIRSIYGIDDIKQWIRTRASDSQFYAENEKKAAALLRDAGLNMAGPVAYAANLTDRILSAQIENVNTEEEFSTRRDQKQIKPVTYSEEQMAENSRKLQRMEIVKELSGNEFSDHSKTLRENVLDFFNSLGNNVYSEEFGDVGLTRSSVRSDIRHGMTRAKNVAYAALPEVIQNGTVIYRIDKGRGLERIVTAAPIKIGAKKYFMAVMLQRDPTSQRLYAHDVVIEEESTSTDGRHLNTNRAGNSENTLFITDILHNALSVKNEPQIFQDNGEVENSTRRQTFSDREILEMATESLDVGTLTPAEQTALDIFKNSLDALRQAQEKRASLGQQYRDEQFTKGGSRAEAEKIHAQMKVLDQTIPQMETRLLELQNKDALKKILVKAREAVETIEKEEGKQKLRSSGTVPCSPYDWRTRRTRCTG